MRQVCELHGGMATFAKAPIKESIQTAAWLVGKAACGLTQAGIQNHGLSLATDGYVRQAPRRWILLDRLRGCR